MSVWKSFGWVYPIFSTTEYFFDLLNAPDKREELRSIVEALRRGQVPGVPGIGLHLPDEKSLLTIHICGTGLVTLDRQELVKHGDEIGILHFPRRQDADPCTEFPLRVSKA